MGQCVQMQGSYYCSFWVLIIGLFKSYFVWNHQTAPSNSEHVTVYSNRLITVI